MGPLSLLSKYRTKLKPGLLLNSFQNLPCHGAKFFAIKILVVCDILQSQTDDLLNPSHTHSKRQSLSGMGFF